MDVAPVSIGFHTASNASGVSPETARARAGVAPSEKAVDAAAEGGPVAANSTDVTRGREVAEREAIEREQREVRQLAKRDREVRAHEQAHASVGGAYAGNPNYQLQRGPNGVSYAVGGHVAIDVSAVSGDPGATLAKMMTVRRAALAPANPSPQDRAVAARASQNTAEARSELAQLKLEEHYLPSEDPSEDRSEARQDSDQRVDVTV